MPKSARKSDISGEKENHASFSANDRVIDGTMHPTNEEEFPPLPVTPSKPPPPKKPALFKLHDTENAHIPDNAVRTLADLINSRSDALEKMVDGIRTDIKLMNEKITLMEKWVEKNENSAQTCLARIADLESYGRRWNLRLQGLPEAEREDVRAEVIKICQQLLPSEREKLPDAIDVAHQTGRRRPDNPKPRGIIIRFVSRRYKEELWKAAKNSAVLQSKGLRFKEDLTIEERDNRQKLWPEIKRARDEGKTAYFVGGRGFINGSELHL